MIDLDRTFCDGRRCPRRKDCDRWIDHALVRDAFAKFKRTRVSSGSFARADGSCDKFSEFDQEEKEKAQGLMPKGLPSSN